MTKLIRRKQKLVFANKPLRALIRELVKEGALVIADPFNHPKINDLGNTVLVKDNREEQVEPLAKSRYSSIIAVGGCTALDIGRACAVGKDLVAIPTILSTDCISVDKSVLKNQGKDRLVQTVAPGKTIISIPVLLDTNPELLSKWSASGFGDLFANIGAAMDQEYKEFRDISVERIRSPLSLIFEALNWAATSFRSFNAAALRKLATWCHNASIMISESNRPAGGEHKLYYAMKEPYPNHKPTHGQLVAVGTLITARIAAERTGDFRLYGELRRAYLNLRLPLDYSGLEATGIEKGHLVRGIGNICPTSLIGEYFSHGDFSLVDRVFEESKKKEKITSIFLTKD